MSDASKSRRSKPRPERSPDDTPGLRVRARNAAVHLIYRRLIGVALVAVLAAAASIVSLVLVVGKPVPPQYIPVTEDGKLLPLVPLDKPNMDNGSIGTFALEAIHAINTYDYINYRDQMSQAESFFSAEGWKRFLAAFTASQTINAVVDRKMIVSVRPTADIQFVSEFVQAQAGVYVWRLAIPVEITYSAHAHLSNGNPDNGSRQRGTISLFISRVPPTVNPRGVAIQSYILDLEGNSPAFLSSSGN